MLDIIDKGEFMHQNTDGEKYKAKNKRVLLHF